MSLQREIEVSAAEKSRGPLPTPARCMTMTRMDTRVLSFTVRVINPLSTAHVVTYPRYARGSFTRSIDPPTAEKAPRCNVFTLPRLTMRALYYFEIRPFELAGLEAAEPLSTAGQYSLIIAYRSHRLPLKVPLFLHPTGCTLNENRFDRLASFLSITDNSSFFL